MNANVEVNKQYAIAEIERRIAEREAAIAYASELMAVQGQEHAYYDWHRSTIIGCIGDIVRLGREIESVRAAPWHDWN